MAGAAFRGVLLLGVLAMLLVAWPGQLTYDSVSQLAEGAANVQKTFGPAMYAWLLGASHHIGGGTGAYLAFSALVLLAALWSLPQLRPRTSWLAVVLAVAVVLSPAVMVYQGIVWKDVMFANFAVAGFVALAHVGGQARRPWRWLAFALAVLCLAMACLVRQNGLIAAVLAALTLGVMLRGLALARAAGSAIATLIAIVFLSQILDAAVQPPQADSARRTDIGLRVLLHYDILGAVAHDPTLALGEIDKVRPQTDDLIRARAASAYSPERVDTLQSQPDLAKSFWKIPAPALKAQWRRIVTGHTGAYLAHRLDAFRWVFLTPDIDRCLPVAAGVEGDPAQLKELGLVAGQDARDLALVRYARAFTHTPAYSHAAYAALALTLLIFLLIRGDAADLAIAGLLGAALATAASYFAISIACDYRYLYILDLAALVGLLYVALDPRLRRTF
ncbi:MAG TPA: hypothetical protein VIO94_05350 [Phenylobacterium sp.]